uniref:Neuroblastoma-amplified sequence n=2 Tax=Cacopsylla melanoneura TaxID=428564 RepID=A0A8D8YSB5_9HEMI
MEGENGDEKLKILYDMLILLVFKKEPELLRSLSSNKIEHSLPVISKQTVLKTSEDAASVLNKLFNWKLAIATQGKLIAVLQENILEIRSSRDEFATPFCKINLEKDLVPELRKISWSPDSNMIAVCYSNGNISAYNIRGVNIFNIICREDDPQPINMFFMDIRTQSTQSSYELIVLYKSGLLKSYKVASDVYEEYHKFQFPVMYPVTDIDFHPAHKVFYVSYAVNYTGKDQSCSNVGLSVWRMLSDYPYYKLSIPEKILNTSVGYFKYVMSMFSKTNDNYIYRTRVSPKGTKLACLHTCGSVSIWSLPSLIFMKKHLLANPPYDINWWDEEHLAMCSHDKYLTIHHFETFVNYLGYKGELLEGVVALPSPKQENCLLILEHNYEFIKRGGEDESVLEEFHYKGNLVWKLYNALKMASLSMFDLGSAPKKKKNRVVKSTYRLLGVQSITPEELLTRKINKEEYEEALVLAKTYGMDADRVYQRQWRYTPVSSHSIQNYLNKITKRLWVLHECCERVPESLKAAKELIEFGLQATNINAVINQDTSLSMEADDYDGQDNIEVCLKKLNNTQLTPEQMELIEMRKQLLHLSDKLFTYQMIIGGPGVAEEAYEKDKYDKFRLQSVLKSAEEYAQFSNAKAVQHILTYHGQQVLPYWLHLLDNFPEICDPQVYKNLLPECSVDGIPHIREQKKIRDKDWCERNWGLFTEETEISAKPVTEYTKQNIMEWYEKRAKAIVERSGLIEVGIEFVKLAMNKNISGLEPLQADLLTLESIVYSYEDELSYMSLEQLQKIEPAKQMILLTSKKETAFLTDLTKKIIPYLSRMEQLHGTEHKSQLVLNYFRQLSVDSIVYVHLFCKHFNWKLLVRDANELSSLVIESVFACRNNEQDQYEKINQTVTLVTGLNISVDVLSRLKHLDAVLACSNILQRYNIDHTWEYIYRNKNNTDIARDILSQVVQSIERNMSPFNIQFVHNLLEDLRLVQARLFQCVPVQDVYRMYVHGLLLSKNIYAIQHCESIISTSTRDRDKLLSYEDSLNFVLEAGRKYINASTSIKDDNLTLARICLKLIKDKENDIQYENNIILAMHVLHEFGVKLVPLGIRNFDNKERLVDKCLEKPRGYKRVNQLSELCDYLSVFHPSERHISVLCRAIDTALRQGDIGFCVDKCLTIVNKGEERGWKVCYQVACRKDVPSLDTRHKLATFSLAHCDTDYILQLIQLKSELRYANVNSTVDSLDLFQEATGSDPEEEESSAGSSLFSVSHFLSLTATTSFWKNMFQLQKEELEEQHVVESFDECSVDEFYADCHKDCSCVEKDCVKLYTSHFINLNLALRLNIDNECSYDKALVTCARMVMGVDSVLALRYLLCLKEVAASEECFNNIPLTRFTCRAALLFFALYHLRQLDPKVAHLPPYQVIKAMRHIVQRTVPTESSSEVKLFLSYVQMEDQFSCIEQLKKFDCGVDVRRFVSDPVYREDTVEGLAMTDSSEMLSLALFLAEKYSLDIYQIVKQHALTLLIGTNTPHKLLDSSIKTSCSQVFTPEVLTRFTAELFSKIPGSNHQSLNALFKFVQTFESNPPISLCNMTVKDHIKFLIKVTVTSPEIDYKSLLDGQLLESIDPILTESSIQSLIRLLKSLPPHLKSGVNLSSVYHRLLMKNLNNYYQCSSSSTDSIVVDELVEFFKKSTSYLSKMEVGHTTSFLKQMIFSNKFNVSVNSRGRVVTLAVQYLQQNVDQSEWPSLKATLTSWQEHIRRVKQVDTVMPIETSAQEHLLEEILRIPVSEEKLETILDRAVERRVIPTGKPILTVMKC